MRSRRAVFLIRGKIQIDSRLASRSSAMTDADPSCRARGLLRLACKRLAYVSRRGPSPGGKCARVQSHDAILRALLPGSSGVIRILDSPSAKPHGILKRRTTAESRARSTIVTSDSTGAIDRRSRDRAITAGNMPIASRLILERRALIKSRRDSDRRDARALASGSSSMVLVAERSLARATRGARKYLPRSPR